MAFDRNTDRDDTRTLQKALAASGFVGFWETDLETKTVYLRGPFARFIGFTSAQIERGAHLSAFVAGIHAEDRERVAALIDEAHRNAGRFEAEFRTTGSDGDTHWVSARGRVQAEAEGVGARCLGVVVDVTDTRQAGAVADRTFGAVSQIVDAMIGLRAQTRSLGNGKLQTLLDLVLFELGRELARSSPPDSSDILH